MVRLKSEVSFNQNNRKKYLIPLNELSHSEQLKYYKSHAIAIPEDLLPERKTERSHKEFDEFFGGYSVKRLPSG